MMLHAWTMSSSSGDLLLYMLGHSVSVCTRCMINACMAAYNLMAAHWRTLQFLHCRSMLTIKSQSHAHRVSGWEVEGMLWLLVLSGPEHLQQEQSRWLLSLADAEVLLAITQTHRLLTAAMSHDKVT